MSKDSQLFVNLRENYEKYFNERWPTIKNDTDKITLELSCLINSIKKINEYVLKSIAPYHTSYTEYEKTDALFAIEHLSYLNDFSQIVYQSLPHEFSDYSPIEKLITENDKNN